MSADRKSEPLPYYRWYWRDWRASRSVQKLSVEARGLYRELLDECWVSGTFADSATTMANIANTTPDVVTTYWPQLKHLFRKRGRRWYSERMDRERDKADELRAGQSVAGKKSAESRGRKKPTTVERPLTTVERPSTSSSSSSSISNSSSSALTAQRSEERAVLAQRGGPPTPISEVINWDSWWEHGPPEERPPGWRKTVS